MAFDIPQRRALKSIQTQKRDIPIQQIMATLGGNPIGQGIENAAASVGQALQQRAAIRRQAQEVAQLEKVYGLKPGELNGIQDTKNAMEAGKQLYGSRQPTYVNEVNNLTGESQMIQVPAGGKYGGTYKFGATPGGAGKVGKPTWIGNNSSGEPLLLQDNGEITIGKVPGGGSVLTKNNPTNIKNQVTEIDDQLKQINDLRNLIGENSGGITGGLKSLASKVTLGAIGSSEKQYNDLKPSIATKIYKAATGDTRLSDADASARAYPLLPDLAEPVHVREAKLKNLEKMLSDRKTGLLPGMLQPLNVPQPGKITPQSIDGYQMEVLPNGPL
jgi:hypothetical protein